MKRNAKVRIIALAALVVMAFAAALASFSFANKDGLNEDSETLLAEASVSKSIIDYIILNSNSVDPTVDTMYHIVELGSSDKPSTLQEMAKNTDNFKDFVFNGNKSESLAELMEAGKIDYKFYQASSIKNTDADKLADIANADFIYISNDPSQKFGGTNDFCEELYNLLHEYTTANYKPLVIDSPTKTTGGTATGDKTGKELVSKYLAKTGALYYTYGLTTTTDVNDFFSGDVSKSLYIGINGRLARTGWENVYAEDDTTTVKKMAKMLVISADGTGDALAQNILTGNAVPTKLSVDGPEDADGNPTYDEIPLTGVDAREIYDITATKLYVNGYNSRYAYRPEYMEVEKAAIADITATTNLDSYDFVVIESSVANTVTADAYNRIVSAMYGNAHILFDSSISKADDTAGTASGNLEDFQNLNYTELFYTVATEKEIARFQNIMVTTRGQFEIITSSASSATAKIIADLINASAWRGIGGPGSTASNFTVLEIQPCYPIDLTIEEKKKTYYTKPADVLDGKTAEQLGYDLNPASKNYKTWYNAETGKWGDSDIEYYAWELSPAKVADALSTETNPVKASDVTVVHMSTEAFECNKQDVLGKYDMIYIGGNTSAFKAVGDKMSLNRLLGWSYDSAKLSASIKNTEEWKKYPLFNMYSHTGDVIDLDFTFLGDTAFKMSGKPLSKADFDATGKNSFIAMSGNDLTYNNYLALKEYVDAGMPIIFSSEAKLGYDETAANGYIQNYIDPDSNMYALMDYCYTKAASTSAIAFGLNEKDIEFVDNGGGDLGDTLTGTVAVFGETAKATMKSCFTAGNKRPKVAVTTMPAQYSQYDRSTRLTSKTLSYTYDINGASDYTVNLYVDDDGNGKFDPSKELFASSKTQRLDYALNGFKGGPVSWKLEVVATGVNGLVTKSSTTGLCYVQPTDKEKSKARVLQIYGADNNAVKMKAFGAQGTLSLLFCPECQMGRHELYYNPTIGTSFRDEDQLFYSGDNYHEAETWQGIYMGRHQHKFGVVRYDSNYELRNPQNNVTIEGRDDWDYNFADELGEDFEFEIDIMSNEEFDDLSKSITAHKDGIKYIPAEKGKDNSLLVITDLDDAMYDALPTELKAKVVKEAVVPAARKAQMKTGYTNLTVEEVADYEKLEQMVADAFLVLKNAVDKNEVETKENDLRNYIDKTLLPTVCTRDSAGNVTSITDQYAYKEYARLLTKKQYHDFFAIYGTSYLGGHRDKDYEALYSDYAKAQDKKLGYEEAYKKFNRFAASYNNNWIEKNWDSVIIGPQENFNCQDITDPAGLAELKEYVVDYDGQVIVFHEGLSRFSDTGAATLTSTLLECFGNDPNHMELDTKLAKDTTVVYPWGATLQPTTTIKFKDGGQVEGYKLQNIKIDGTTDLVTVNVVRKQHSWDNGYDNEVTITKSDKATKPGDAKIKFNFSQVDKNGNNENADFTGTTVALNFNNTSYFGGQNRTFKYNTDGTVAADNTLELSVNNTYTELVGADALRYLPYTTKAGYSSDKYFLSTLSYKTGDDKYFSWQGDYKAIFSNFATKKYYALNPYSSTQFMTDTRGNNKSNPYKYSTLDWSKSTAYGSDQKTKVGTNKATQNNAGIITTYPFTLANELNVTGTHPSAYAVDVEDDNMTVWYSMAGGTYADREMSDHYAATPLDGKDNYFIYSYGNVYYCGAGHTCVTGKGKDNNDERRLYINIICNAVRKMVAGPSIDVFDYGTTDNKKIIKGSDGYTYEIPDDLEYPDFTYRATVDKEAKIDHVNIYYKLDTTSGSLAFKTKVVNGKTVDEDRWIAKLPNGSTKLEDIASGKLVDIGVVRDKDGVIITDNAFNKLFKLDNRDDNTDLFAPYGGNFTYIVIEVVDNKGNVSYQKIKIVRKGHLFDLT